jgi:hypothetical protein
MGIFDKLGKALKGTKTADSPKVKDAADPPKVKLSCGLCRGTGRRTGHGYQGDTCSFCEGRGWYWGKA